MTTNQIRVDIDRQTNKVVCIKDPEYASVYKHRFRWELAAGIKDTWKIDSIVFDEPNNQIIESFKNGKDWECKHKNTVLHDVPYTVYLIDADGTRISSDPTIKNGSKSLKWILSYVVGTVRDVIKAIVGFFRR